MTAIADTFARYPLAPLQAVFGYQQFGRASSRSSSR